MQQALHHQKAMHIRAVSFHNVVLSLATHHVEGRSRMTGREPCFTRWLTTDPREVC